ncbi:YadA-like family protein [Burkholderia gladioli]
MMNKSYKVVWNTSNGTWAVASEVARSRKGRQSSKRTRIGYACGRKAALVAMGVVVAVAAPTSGALAGTVIGGGGSGGSNINGGTNFTGGGLGKSYIGAAAQGSVITGDDDCLSLSSRRLIMNKANLGYLLGMTSQTIKPDNAWPVPTTINGVEVGYKDHNPDITGGGRDNPNSDQATVAWGFNSFAGGCGNKSLGAGSTSTGMQNRAELSGSTAMGIANDAAGAGATAIGLYNTASGTGSTAIGIGSTAAGAGAIALGSGGAGTPENATIARGEHSIAIGGDDVRGAQAVGNDAIALGGRSSAKEERAIAVGWNASVAKAGSVAIGADSVSQRGNEVSVGSDSVKRQITHVADATEASDAVTFGQMKQALTDASFDGDGVSYDNAKHTSVTFGGSSASGPVQLKNVAEGAEDTDAVNLAQLNEVRDDIKGSLAEGSLAMRYIKVKAKGAMANVAGMNSVAIGSAANATANGALALGAGSRATGRNSVAVGFNSVADEADQVSVGDYGYERRISHLANGVDGNDAVNVGQLTDAVKKMTERTDKLSSDLRSRNGLLTATTYAAGARTAPTFVAVDGMGSDGSLENIASVGEGDPQTVSAVAVGLGSAAAGSDAVSIGLRSIANSDNSVALGNKAATGADQPYSVAIGSEVTTNGVNALVIGSQGKANGSNAVAVGNNHVAALAQSAIAIGDGAQSLVGTTNGIAVGKSATIETNVADAMALGANTYVARDAEGAVALGTGSSANRANTVSVGGGVAGTRQIVNVAAGTQGTDAVNVGQLNEVVTALGGGASIAADGSMKAPAYHVGDKTYGNVGDAIAAAAETGGGGVDPNAITYDDEAKGSITLAGENGTKLKKLAAGDVSATSTEAVNGSQLHGTAQSVASALGGGSSVDTTGKVTAPTYALNGGAATAHSVGEAVSNLDDRVITNAAGLAGLKGEFADSGLVDKTTGKTIAAVTYDRNADGTANRGSVTLIGTDATSPVALKNVAAGAVTAMSADAVNGSQLFGTSQSVATALGGGSLVDATGKVTAPTYHVGDKTYGNVGDAIAAAAETGGGGVDPNAIAYDDEAKGSITLAGENGTKLKKLAAGDVSATSTEAVNGSQLHGTAQSVASALGGGSSVDTTGKVTAPTYALNGGAATAHSVGEAVSNLDDRVITNAAGLAGLKGEFADSGLVDKTTGKTIAAVTYDRNADGTANRGSVTLIGTDATSPVALKNVAAGVADTDAVNVGQLNSGLSDVKRELADGSFDLKYIKVKATGAAAYANGAQSVAIGPRASAGGPSTLALGSGARALQLGSVAIGANSVAEQAMTVSVGDVGAERKIVNVRKGEISARSTDAVNGSQLYDALGGLKSLVANEQSTFMSQLDSLARRDANGGIVAVDGMGSDGSLENIASVGEGDPQTVSAVAVGLGSAAAGSDAVSIGLRSIANSDNSVALGNKAATGADQPYSVAIGSEVTTNGVNALVIGSQGKANGSNAVAVGNNHVAALAQSAIAIGDGAQSLVGTTNGIAVGKSATIETNVADAMALGANTYVARDAEGAVALGTGSSANRANTVSVGGGVAGTRQIVNVAAGTQGTDAVNVGQLNEVVTALGGGASIAADGSMKAPAYHVGDKTYGNVGDAIAAAAETGGGGVDPNAITYDDEAKGSITLAGENGTKLKKLAAGDVSATSTEAVNGSQLHGTAQSVANALGGGAAVGDDGTISAPSYSLAGGGVTVHSIGEAIGNLDGRITTNTGDISKLKNTLSDSGLIDPTTGQAFSTVVYDRNDGGSPNRTSITLGATGTPVALHNVANGAVTGGSRDAVNGSQLHSTALSVANAIGGDTTVDENGQLAVKSIEVSGHKYSSVSEAVQAVAAYGATDSLAVRYDLDSHGNPNYGSITLGGPAAAPVILTNVADGNNQYDAVNYGQLSSLQSDFENRLDSVDGRVAKLETDGGDAGRASKNYVRDTTAGGDLVNGSAADGLPVTPSNPGNGSNNMVIGSGATINNGVNNATAIGANSTVEATNGTAIGAGSDAHATNSTAIGQDSSARGENSTAIGQGSKAHGDNSVAIGTGSVANENGTVSFGDGTDHGNRRIVHIADGVDESDAATKGQLDRAVGGLQGRINDVSRNAYSGIAAATALTMIPGVDPGKTLSFGIGGATYKGYQAVAFGGEARVTQNLKMKAGVGLSSGGNTVGVGASYQW